MNLSNFSMDNLTPTSLEEFFQSVWREVTVNERASDIDVKIAQAKVAYLFPTCSALEAKTARLAHDSEKKLDQEADTNSGFDRARRTDTNCFMAKFAEKECNRLEGYGMLLASQLKNFKKELDDSNKPGF